MASNGNGNSSGIGLMAMVATMLTTAGLVWSITWAVTSSRIADQDKRVTNVEKAIDQYREFRGEMTADMRYVKSRLDEVVNLVRTNVGER